MDTRLKWYMSRTVRLKRPDQGRPLLYLLRIRTCTWAKWSWYPCFISLSALPALKELFAVFENLKRGWNNHEWSWMNRMELRNRSIVSYVNAGMSNWQYVHFYVRYKTVLVHFSIRFELIIAHNKWLIICGINYDILI